MRLNPPRLGEILAGASGLLLAFSLVLPWYRSSTAGGAGSRDATGFEALTVLDIYLLIVAAGGAGLLAVELTQRTPAIAVAWAALATPLGIIAVALTLWRTLDPAGGPGTEPVFALLGLAASTGVTVGGLLSMRDEGFGIRPKPGLAATTRGAGEGPVPEPLPPAPSGDPRQSSGR